jgi:predicted dinucleotide-utilizing enzyme
MKSLLLIGFGAMGRTVFEALRAHRHARIACVVETTARRDDVQRELGAYVSVVTSVDALPHRPDLALECAGHDAVTTFVPSLLAQGIDTIIASVGALAEPGLPERLEVAASRGNAQLVLVPGAIAGIDALRAARQRPLASVTYTGRKPPRGWLGTPAEARVDLTAIREATVIFEGNARGDGRARGHRHGTHARDADRRSGRDAQHAQRARRRRVRGARPHGLRESATDESEDVGARRVLDSPRDRQPRGARRDLTSL